MAAIFRDSPAGQILRVFLGMKIAPYMDEREDFKLSRTISRPSHVPAPGTEATDVINREDESEIDQSEGEKEISDKELERNDTNPTGAPKGKPDHNVVEFTGSDDEDNPQNWSSRKKIFVFIQICLLTFSSKCSAGPPRHVRDSYIQQSIVHLRSSRPPRGCSRRSGVHRVNRPHWCYPCTS
jgi:DHA1 family multidrug resistance protein-like MFS transporter